MRIPLHIALNRFLLCLVIGGLVTTPVQGSSPTKIQVDRATPKVLARQDEPALAQPHSAAEKATALEYWIGVSCEETSPLLRAHLKVEGGLAINDIVADTPAQKAELQIHDVILTINDKPLQTVDELRQIVQASQGGALDLDIMRGGQQLSLTLKPELLPPCGELERILIPMDGDKLLDDRQFAELQNFLQSQPGIRERTVLLLQPAVKLDKEIRDEPSGEKGHSKKAKTPNGAGLHIQREEMEKEAFLFDSAEFDKGQALSGCCLKLLKRIGEQIELHNAEIQKLQTELEAVSKVKASQTFDGNDAAADLEREIKLLEESRDTLIDAGARLKAEIDARPKSDVEETEPEQSKRLEFRLRNWS